MKLKLENTVKLFKIYLDYQQPKVLAVNNNSKEEKEIEKVISDNKIEINSLNNKDDIKIKKIKV